MAILALNSDRYLEIYYAVWWLGAVVVPMNIRWSVAENAYSITDSGSKVMFVDAQFAPMAATAPLLAAGAIAFLTVAVNFVVDWMLHKSSGLKE